MRSKLLMLALFVTACNDPSVAKQLETQKALYEQDLADLREQVFQGTLTITELQQEIAINKFAIQTLSDRVCELSAEQGNECIDGIPTYSAPVPENE